MRKQLASLVIGGGILGLAGTMLDSEIMKNVGALTIGVSAITGMIYNDIKYGRYLDRLMAEVTFDGEKTNYPKALR